MTDYLDSHAFSITPIYSELEARDDPRDAAPPTSDGRPIRGNIITEVLKQTLEDGAIGFTIHVKWTGSPDDIGTAYAYAAQHTSSNWPEELHIQAFDQLNGIEAAIMIDPQAAEHDVLASSEAMDVEAGSGPDLLPHGEAARLTEIKQRVLAAGIGERHEVSVTVDGGERYYDVILEPRRDQSRAVVGLIGVALDITARKETENRVQYLAHHDSLTGLPNRVLFRERMSEGLEQVARSGEPMALLCLDLDHFKSINDTLGHPVGDVLLGMVGCMKGTTSSTM